MFIITDGESENIKYFLLLFPEMKSSARYIVQISALKIELIFGRNSFYLSIIYSCTSYSLFVFWSIREDIWMFRVGLLDSLKFPLEVKRVCACFGLFLEFLSSKELYLIGLYSASLPMGFKGFYIFVFLLEKVSALWVKIYFVFEVIVGWL